MGEVCIACWIGGLMLLGFTLGYMMGRFIIKGK